MAIDALTVSNAGGTFAGESDAMRSGRLSAGTMRNTAVITDGVVSPETKASFDGRGMASQIEHGYSVALGDGFRVEPQAGWQYGRLWLDGTTEEGADALPATPRGCGSLRTSMPRSAVQPPAGAAASV
jgi:hypothetical protein